MATIYEAIDEATHESVAIKAVSGLEEGFLVSLRREIRVLLSIDHPALVRIIDHGLYDDRPWFAMEYIEGVSLREHLETSYETRVLPTVPEFETLKTRPMRPVQLDQPVPRVERDKREFERLLTHVAKICRGLSFMHGHGLLHRDLKPENIVIRGAGGDPVLVDFGIASRSVGGRREYFSRQNVVAGTPAYMSPEQAQNLWVDARADLYAIGCILYEIVAGHPPFGGDSPVQVLMSHVFDPVRELDEAVDPELRALIMQLLAKNPDDRPGYADIVARRLEEYLGIEASASPPGPLYVYRPSFVGRETEMAVCRERIEALRGGRGSTTLIVGRAGTGKTRFALELIDAIRSYDGVEALIVEVGDESGDRPFKAMIAQIADRCRARGPDFARFVLGEEGAALAGLYPEIMNVPGMEGFDVPPPLPRNLEKLRRTHAWIRLVLRLGGPGSTRPVAVVIDQLSDALIPYLAESREAIEREGLPIGLFVTYDRERYEAGVEFPESDVLELGPLDDTSIETVAQTMLAMDAAPPELVDLLKGRAQGRPAQVADYLMLAVESGMLKRTSEGHWTVDSGNKEWTDLPDLGGQSLPMARRLASLPESSLSLISFMAVYGYEIPVGVLARALPARKNLAAIDPLLGSGMIVPTEDHLAFSKTAIRQAILSSIEPDELRELHLRVASSMLENGDETLETARHLARGGDVRRARAIALECADEHRSLRHTHEALTFYFSLDPPANPATFSAVLQFVQTSLRLHRTKDTFAHAERWAASALAAGHVETYAQLNAAKSMHLAVRHELVQARQTALSALEVCTDKESSASHFLYYSLGVTDLYGGAFRSAIDWFEKAREGFSGQESFDPRHAAVYINLAAAYLNIHRIQTCQSMLDAAQKLLAQHPIPLIESRRLEYVATLEELYYDAPHKALAIYQTLAHQYLERHDSAGLGYVNLQRAGIYRFLHRFEKAQECLKDTAFLLTSPVSERERIEVQLERARLHACRNEHTQALEILKDIEPSCAAYGLHESWILVHARILRRIGRIDEAAASLAQFNVAEFEDDGWIRFVYEAECFFTSIAQGLDAHPPTPAPDSLSHRRVREEYAAVQLAQRPHEVLWYGEPKSRVLARWPNFEFKP